MVELSSNAQQMVKDFLNKEPTDKLLIKLKYSHMSNEYEYVLLTKLIEQTLVERSLNMDEVKRILGDAHGE